MFMSGKDYRESLRAYKPHRAIFAALSQPEYCTIGPNRRKFKTSFQSSGAYPLNPVANCNCSRTTVSHADKAEKIPARMLGALLR